MLDTDWHIVGSADANLDGYNDLYWQHQGTGHLAIWLMRETTRLSGQLLVPDRVEDTQWKVRAVTDLDGDRAADLIWQHEGDGRVAVWFMLGAQQRYGVLLSPGEVADLNWTIVGSGDANRDGYQDLFWHHRATGHVAVWLMRGRTAIAGELLTPDRVADLNWQVRGVADFDRNGFPDLVWQNTATREVAAWLLNGLTLIDGRLIAGPLLPTAAWRIVSPR